jgi:hypothetical protein
MLPVREFPQFTPRHATDNFNELPMRFKNILPKAPLFGGFHNFTDLIANQSKRLTQLDCDAYFGGKLNFIFEFDEFQHFSTARLKTFEFYPSDLLLNFSISEWKAFCNANKIKADKYRHNKTTTDFNFRGGRTAQRAYLDCFRDLLPAMNGLNPTLRINDFEVEDIYLQNSESYKKIERILKTRLK